MHMSMMDVRKHPLAGGYADLRTTRYPFNNVKFLFFRFLFRMELSKIRIG